VAMEKVVNCVILSFFFLCTCMGFPITFGASCTALYYTVNKSIRRERGYVWKEYFSAFSKNFGIATKCWLMAEGVMALFVLAALAMRKAINQGLAPSQLFYPYLVLIFIEFLWLIYLFPYVARFEGGVKEVIKNTMLIAIGNLPKTLACAVITVLCAVAAYFVPILIFLFPALCTWWINLILEGVFRKYMSEEDIKKEEELDQSI